MDKASREYEVCLCMHITRGEIEDIIRENSITSLKEFSAISNIGSKCGGCRLDIEEIITEINKNK